MERILGLSHLKLFIFENNRPDTRLTSIPEHIAKPPSFIIGGAPKSATTTLSRYLSRHTQVYMPEQEMNYYAFYENTVAYKKLQIDHVENLESYQSHFRLSPEQKDILCGEKSVSYLYEPWSDAIITKIKRMHPNPEELKFIFILRQPVERMYSQYIFNCSFDEDLPFTEAIEAWPSRNQENWLPAYDYVGASMYANAIKKYQENFKNVKVYLFDDLISDRKQLLNDLAEFLEINPDEFMAMKELNYNVGRIPEHPVAKQIHRVYKLKGFKKITNRWLSEKIKQKLKSNLFSKAMLDEQLRSTLADQFREDIQQLENLIGRDLKHWLI